MKLIGHIEKRNLWGGSFKAAVIEANSQGKPKAENTLYDLIFADSLGGPVAVSSVDEVDEVDERQDSHKPA